MPPKKLPILNYPCPKCGQPGLAYDGMLAWPAGPRPDRALARQDLVPDKLGKLEHQRIYHCSLCGGEFFEDMRAKRTHLYEEGREGKHVYNTLTGKWEHKLLGKRKKSST